MSMPHWWVSAVMLLHVQCRVLCEHALAMAVELELAELKLTNCEFESLFQILESNEMFTIAIDFILIILQVPELRCTIHSKRIRIRFATIQFQLIYGKVNQYLAQNGNQTQYRAQCIQNVAELF